MSDSWFKEKLAPDGDMEDGCHPDEAKALQSYLSNEITAQEAARAITIPVLSADDPGGNLHRLWGLLQDALEQLSAARTPTLIALLQAIENLPDPISSDGRPIYLREGYSWKELPGFGHEWADCYQQDHWRYELPTVLAQAPTVDEGLKKRVEMRAAHVKIVNAEAQLVVAGVGGLPLDWGYDTVANALERKTAIPDFDLRAVREWMKVAGKELYQGAKDGMESWALERKRDMGKENGKMDLARWKFWEERIREYESQGEDIGDTLAIMEKLAE
ncbi:MAG: hypothetical protein Q9219_006983 [cf. Caloplaca sp. 3 TL-2023]